MKAVAISLVILFILIAIVVVYFMTSKRRKRPYYSRREKRWKKHSPSDMDFIRHTLFLIGDAGAPSLIHPDNVLELLKKKMAEAGEKSMVFFLGDNIYPVGMPRPNDPMHDQSERRLVRQMEAVKDHKGKVYFISGNHDWNKGRKGGYEAVRRQQFYVESFFGSQEVFLPRNGCPGPVLIPVNRSMSIVVINTQWWVHTSDKPIGKAHGCTVESEHEFFVELEKMLEQNKDKQLVVIGHHPVYSQAYHGGNFSVKQHLFPLTELNKRLYVPIPLAGSIYPMYRKYIGSREDMSHPKYKNMRKRLIDIFSKYDNLIYASGHDHNLQYIRKSNQHYLISGAGCKVNYVQKGDGARFTHAHKGFMKLDFYFNGDVWLEVWEPSDEDETKGYLAYRKQIVGGMS